MDLNCAMIVLNADFASEKRLACQFKDRTLHGTLLER